MTKIIKNIEEAIPSILNGELVIFPTETVYGIGANALDSKAVERIYEAKGRKNDNPLIVHVSDKKMLYDLVFEVSEIEEKLINAFMPGPFTLILKKKNIIPDIVTSNLDTVAVRMPKSKLAHDLIKYSGVPIAAPSANISGKPSGTKVTDIKKEFEGNVSYIIDGGSSEIGLESTVCKVIDGIPTILRPGKVTLEEIIDICGCGKLSKNINEITNEKVESPGLKYKHYAPKTECLLIYSETFDNLVQEIKKHLDKRIVVIGSSTLFNRIKELDLKFLNYGDALESIAHNIFSLLREADTLECDIIIIEGVKSEGLGLAIMNRLIKASSHNYYEV